MVAPDVQAREISRERAVGRVICFGA